MEDLKYYLAFNQINGFGPIRFNRLLTNFSTLAEAWSANSPELIACGFSETEADRIIVSKSKIDPDQELYKLNELEISAVTIKDTNYPSKLKEIYDAPAILYYRGNLNCLQQECLAVVGARKHTAYGQMAIEKIVEPLAQAGLTIVSGLALGIDALAHQSALKAGGLTVAVLGSDLQWKNIGPKTNFYLAEKILDENGCLLSEFPLETEASRSTFPQRNRIVSGLCRGVLVIEAAENSGTLITVGQALDQNRDVFAVPGNIFSKFSEGTNNLIRRGAKITASAEDILTEFNLVSNLKLDKKGEELNLTETESIIMKQLNTDPLSLDKLAEIINIKINVLNSQLILLELKGLIKNIGNNQYIKK